MSNGTEPMAGEPIDGTKRFMSDEEKVAWRERAIVNLLTCPKVGPLTFGAICINLGATGAEQEVHEALSRLLEQGTVRRAGSTAIPGLQGDRATLQSEDLFGAP